MITRLGPSSVRRPTRVLAVMLILLALHAPVSFGWADYPSYPPEPTVVEYAVDPAWPERPAELGPRAAVPGVAVDNEDRIWCVERGEVPVQVYTAEGKLVRSWGQGQLGSPHNIRFDGQGNVWIVDFKDHAIKKFTPQGKLLLTLGVPGESGEDETHFKGPTECGDHPVRRRIRDRRLRQSSRGPLRLKR